MRTYNPVQRAGRWTCRPSYRSLAVPALALAPEERGLLLESFFFFKELKCETKPFFFFLSLSLSLSLLFSLRPRWEEASSVKKPTRWTCKGPKE